MVFSLQEKNKRNKFSPIWRGRKQKKNTFKDEDIFLL